MKLSLILVIALVLVACTDDPVTPTPVPVSITKANIVADSALGALYYSLEGDSVVPNAKAATAEWDVKLPYLQCCGRTQKIDVVFNSGTVGVGSTQAAIVEQRYETIDTVPVVSFKNDDTTTTNRIVPIDVIGAKAMFVYDITSHTLRPSPNKTLLVKTKNGTVVKFQITNIYKDNTPTPTSETPIGYYHIRYVKAVNGKF